MSNLKNSQLDFIPKEFRGLFFKFDSMNGHYGFQCQECPSRPKIGNKKQVLSRIERDSYLGVCRECISKSLRGKTLVTDEEIIEWPNVLLIETQRMENKIHILDRICISCDNVNTLRVSKLRAMLKRGTRIKEKCVDCRALETIKITLEGYVIEKDASHPNAGNTGWVLQHRKVISDAIGRPLKRTETVHHINGDRTDNRLENLQLRQGDHGVGVYYKCLDCGSHNVEGQKI